MSSTLTTNKMRSARNAAFVSAFSRVGPVRSTTITPTCTLLRVSSFTSSSCASSKPLYRTSNHQFQSHTRRHSPFPFPIYASAAPQQDNAWNEVKVVSVTQECEAHTLLSINVGVTFELGSLTDAYRVPGMYVKLLPAPLDEDKKPAFLAISSPPTITGIFEFLIKDSDSTNWIKSLQPGDSVFSSPVQGPGFRLAGLEPPPQNILLFATGSGIAPIRAAIESPLNGVFPNTKESVTLFYGAQTPQKMPYRGRFEEWRKNGVKVVPVISRPNDSNEPWDSYTGYVQHVMEEMDIGDLKDTAALLCGLRGMTDDVKQKLIDSGMPEKNVLFNF